MPMPCENFFSRGAVWSIANGHHDTLLKHEISANNHFPDIDTGKPQYQ